jgi:hypothetical protein
MKFVHLSAVLQIDGTSLVFAEGSGSPAVGGNVLMVIYSVYVEAWRQM